MKTSVTIIRAMKRKKHFKLFGKPARSLLDEDDGSPDAPVRGPLFSRPVFIGLLAVFGVSLMLTADWFGLLLLNSDGVSGRIGPLNVARVMAVLMAGIAAPSALLAVLKADGYGHGAVRVARTALLHGADYLATACLSEAVALRGHGIGAPILILGFTPPWQAAEIVRYNLTATVYNLETARHLARAAQRSRGTGRPTMR